MEDKKGKQITIKRIASNDAGTFGVVLDGDTPFCVSCELPWKDNQKNISCIPNGYFEAMRVQSPRFGNTFEVKGGSLGDRTHVLFHTGNFALKDSKGCILLAEGFGQNDHVERSRVAFNEFIERTKDCEYFILRIMEDYS
jgi:hypothetical protein